MKTVFFLFVLTATSAQAAGVRINCAYKFQNVDFSSVQFDLFEDGTLSPVATITHYGKSFEEPLTAVAATGEERVHAWISKDSPDNSLELIVYKEPQKEGISKMVNPHIPFGNVMWGNCTFQ